MSTPTDFRARAAGAVLLLSAAASAAAADWTPAGDLEGTPVETRDGQRVGQVHDFAVDIDSGRIHYVVVSIGSFLVDDSLIAVHPDALRRSADAERVLVLERDAAALRNARRFTDANWPDTADVTPEQRSTEGDAEATGQPEGGRGTATISSDSKTATLAAGERRIEVKEASRPAAASARSGGGGSPPDGSFARLDEDGNGLLDRSEIAHQMGREDRYADIDTNADGAIDPDEFAALMRRRGAAGE